MTKVIDKEFMEEIIADFESLYFEVRDVAWKEEQVRKEIYLLKAMYSEYFLI